MGVLQALQVKHCTCQVIFSACITSWKGATVSQGQDYQGQELTRNPPRWDQAGKGQSQALTAESKDRRWKAG